MCRLEVSNPKYVSTQTFQNLSYVLRNCILINYYPTIILIYFSIPDVRGLNKEASCVWDHRACTYLFLYSTLYGHYVYFQRGEAEKIGESFATCSAHLFSKVYFSHHSKLYESSVYVTLIDSEMHPSLLSREFDALKVINELQYG